MTAKAKAPAQAPMIPAPITMMKLSQLSYASEAPPELGLQVRKGDDTAGLDDLIASVRTHGVIVPLVFKKHQGKNYTIAGNRRLRVARQVYGEMDVELQAIDTDDLKGDPREIALATNVALPPHPVERFEVISALVKEGMSHDDAKLRFGLSDKVFRQTMKLGSLCKEVREAYRDGEIDGKTAQAFTLMDAAGEQKKVFADLSKSSREGIRYEQVVEKVRSTGEREVTKLIKFVGVQALRKVKILKQEDMFGDNHTVTNVSVLKAMADAMLLEVADTLVKRDGWAWAVPADQVKEPWYYQSLPPGNENPKPTKEQARRMGDIAAILSKPVDDESWTEAERALHAEYVSIEEAVRSSAWKPEQRAKTGCFVSVSYDGLLKIERAKMKPEERRSVQASENASKKADKPKKKPGEVALTQALAGRLSDNLQKAIAKAIVKEPAVACAALLAGFAAGGHVLNVRAAGDGGAHVDPKKRSADFHKVFEAVRRRPPLELMAMLAVVAGKAVDVATSDPSDMPLADAGALALADALRPQALDAALREEFDAKAYFESVTVEAIALAVTDVLPSQGDEVRRMKKKDAVKFAMAHVAKTSWLPPELRTSRYAGPRKAEKAKKPAGRTRPKNQR